MSITTPPRVFYRFADGCMDWSDNGWSSTASEIIELALEQFDRPEHLRELLAYLDELVDGDIPDVELKRLWDTTSAQVKFVQGADNFLRHARDATRDRLRSI
jgi:hypothetical protein